MIFAKFLEQLGEDSRFEILFEEYLELLPAEFKDLIDKSLFKKKRITKAELENEISRLSYKVLERIVLHGMRDTNKPMPTMDELNSAIADYKSTQNLLKRSKSLSIFNKDIGKNSPSVFGYLKSLAKNVISSLVGYCNGMSDKVLRFYSTKEIEIEEQEYAEDLMHRRDEELNYFSRFNDIERGL